MELKDIGKLIDKDNEYVVRVRRYLHAHPELSKKEYETSKFIINELHSFGLETKLVGETGVYSEIIGLGEGNDEIVLRADIDALPIEEVSDKDYKSVNNGVMHACGHDCHTACLLAAAKFLASNRHLFGGKIILNFQQAEEVGYGARLFVDGGYLGNATRSFGLHVASNIPVGKIAVVPGSNNASVDWFRITVHGSAAHTSTPELGVDAAYIVSQININLQSIVARMSNPIDSVLIGVGKIEAGTAYNIVAAKGFLEGSLRTLTHETRRNVIKKIEEVATLTAEIFGGSIEIEWKDFTSCLINDEKSAVEARDVAVELFGKDNVITSRKPSLGGDDFAEYIIKVPGVYAYVGSGNINKPETVVAQHDCHYDVDEECLTVGTKMYICYSLEYLNK